MVVICSFVRFENRISFRERGEIFLWLFFLIFRVSGTGGLGLGT